MKYFVLVVLIFGLVTPCIAKVNIKVRAREHFVEDHMIDFGDGRQVRYTGLSNTINIWQEVPFQYSIGLSISPVLGSSETEDPLEPLGSKIQFFVYGIEGKYFPVTGYKAFVRGGLGFTRIETSNSVEPLEGASYYVGLGWEVPVWKIHLAPEIAARKSDLTQGVSVESTIFSLGFHFYQHF